MLKNSTNKRTTSRIQAKSENGKALSSLIEQSYIIITIIMMMMIAITHNNCRKQLLGQNNI